MDCAGYIGSVSFLNTVLKVVEKLRSVNPQLTYGQLDSNSLCFIIFSPYPYICFGKCMNSWYPRSSKLQGKYFYQNQKREKRRRRRSSEDYNFLMHFFAHKGQSWSLIDDSLFKSQNFSCPIAFIACKRMLPTKL